MKYLLILTPLVAFPHLCIYIISENLKTTRHYPKTTRHPILHVQRREFDAQPAITREIRNRLLYNTLFFTIPIYTFYFNITWLQRVMAGRYRRWRLGQCGFWLQRVALALYICILYSVLNIMLIIGSKNNGYNHPYYQAIAPHTMMDDEQGHVCT